MSKILEKNKKYSITPWTSQNAVKVMNIVKGEGVYIYNEENKKYIDFASQLISANIGHGDQRVTEAVTEQMNKISHLSPLTTTTEVKVLLAEKLNHIYPKSLEKTLFTLGGSDANETAAMIARVFKGRKKIISNYRSYHGSSVSTFNIGGDPRKFNFLDNDFGGTVKIENPYVYRCPWGTDNEEDCKKLALEHVQRVIEYQNPKTIAAIIMEGESGSSGCFKYPKGYLKEIRKICDQYDLLLIIDEVMSGFGRCGEWFASIYHDVQPDIMTIAKGLTSGYLPLGGVALNSEITDFLETFDFTFGLTYCNHPVSCAAALKVVSIYEEDDLIENCRNISLYFKEQLNRLVDKHPCIGDIRLTGLLGVVEFVKNRKNKDPFVKFNTPVKDWGKMLNFKNELSKNGLHVMIRWNLLFISPPLCITKEQAEESLFMIEKALPILDEDCY